MPILIKVWSPEGKLRQTRVNPPKGARFNAAGIESLLSSVAKQINDAWPEDKYEIIIVSATQYNFVHRGKKEVSRILDASGESAGLVC